MNPLVSFVVPCYKLAHLLPECLRSILSQSYQGFEVLVMDDASPDNTAEVVHSFSDKRVKYVRNEPNLGHLANYNKGIGLASGEYIWLISADDSLRSTQVLQKYVDLMEKHRNVGYTICPGVGVSNGEDLGLLSYSVLGTEDAVFPGREFLFKLLEGNRVLAASGMVRKECYERHGAFPLDMPYAGDWYLWCLFAVYYDVGYLAEPMVNYRQHDLSMTNVLQTASERILMRDNISVLWRIKRECERAVDVAFAEQCTDFIVKQYARAFLAREWRNADACLTTVEFEASLEAFSDNETERREIRSRVFFRVGDHCYWEGHSGKALEYYRQSLRQKFFAPLRWLKYILLRMGHTGAWIRRASARSFAWRKPPQREARNAR